MRNDRGRSIIIQIRRLIQKYDSYTREDFSRELEQLVREQLLHIGVNTHDILRGYAAIVKYLSQYDPSLVLVHKICRTIRDYVKQRPDTMRTIITFITTEKPGDGSELTANANRLTLMLDEEQLQDVNDEYVIMVDDNMENRWMDWKPDPHDANPRESRLYRESADVFNMLVSIYGSKDLFVKEYQQLLAERLIVNGWDKHFHSEFLYLETMKRRFTEGELNHCEVMLRDIRESGKLANYAAQDLPFPISPRTISFVYWPEITEKENSLPILPCFREGLDTYEKTYTKHKVARSITWFSDFGSTVEMEITLEGQVVQVEAPLIQAQILILFTEKERWDVEELRTRTGLDKHGLKRRMEWWSSKGLLIPGPLDEITLEETYCLARSATAIERFVKQQGEQNPTMDEMMLSDEEEEEQVPVEDMVEELEQYWSYTKNLLKFRSATDPLTALALHRLYKNFTSPGKAVPTLDAVQLFMQRKIRQNLVVLENGVYKPTKELT